MLQTELVACALCEADGNNPDAVVPADEADLTRLGPETPLGKPVMIRAWQRYEGEARKLVIAARAMEKFSSTLEAFRSIGVYGRDIGHA